MIVAVDGPAASGKGTLAKRLAAHYGLAHLDTGRIYRAVAAAMQSAGAALEDETAAIHAAHALDFAVLGDPALGSAEAGEGASRIAVMPALRAVLVARQRAFAHAAGGQGAVLDGRDIGTVVLPDADVKLFVTAAVDERARRRAMEIYGEADGPRYQALLAQLKQRDARDESRSASPLKPAADAHILDTTAMSADAAFLAATRLVDKVPSA